MKVRALLVDDEPLARRSVSRFLKNDPEVVIIGECGDGATAVKTIRSENPDLVLLDIQMPEMDGFEVVRQIGPERMPATIFVTAYDRYALRAFDINALDYLLKPVERSRFERALLRAKERIAERLQREVSERIMATLEQVKRQEEYLERLPVAENGRILLLKIKEIDWIEAEGNYCRLHVGQHSYEIRETLTALDDKLNPRDFARIHRSTIVNVHRIREIQPWFHGYHVVLLENGRELRMSRYKDALAKQLGIG
jgi:two-component system, LytTR family, response regulator